MRANNRAREPSVLNIEVCHSYKIHINVILTSLFVYTIGDDFKSIFLSNRLFYSINNNNNISVDKKSQLDVTFVFFISLLLVAQHVSGNHVPIIRS